MIDEKLVQIRAKTANIRRYRRLLQTQLTELERDYIQRRLNEEQEALSVFISKTSPLAVGVGADRLQVLAVRHLKS